MKDEEEMMDCELIAHQTLEHYIGGDFDLISDNNLSCKVILASKDKFKDFAKFLYSMMDEDDKSELEASQYDGIEGLCNWVLNNN